MADGNGGPPDRGRGARTGPGSGHRTGPQAAGPTRDDGQPAGAGAGPTRDDGQRGRVAQGIVAFLGLYQGAVPLVARALFGADQRFAPALWLPAPWWWPACLVVVVVTLALLAIIDARVGGRPTGAGGPQAPAAPRVRGGDAVLPEGHADAGGRAKAHDALSAVVFLVGFYNGVAPFVSRLAFDGDLLLAVTLHLPSPWWWVASLAVLAVTAVLLEAIDRAGNRA